MIAGSHPSIPVRTVPLAGGDAGIAQTISVMHSLIDRGAVDPQVREQALAIVRQAGAVPRDSGAEINAIFWWAKAHMRFQKDVHGGEYVSTPQYLLRTMAGDCDDYVVLTGSLLKSLGVPIRIVTIAADREEPGRLSHVYLEALSKGEWIALDATQAQSVPGWKPPRYFRKKVWDSPGLNRQAVSPAVGMGDFSTDISAITPLASVIGQSVAQSIAAANPPSPYAGYAGTPGAPGFSIESGVSGTISPWILLAGAAIVAVLLFKRN